MNIEGQRKPSRKEICEFIKNYVKEHIEDITPSTCNRENEGDGMVKTKKEESENP